MPNARGCDIIREHVENTSTPGKARTHPQRHCPEYSNEQNRHKYPQNTFHNGIRPATHSRKKTTRKAPPDFRPGRRHTVRWRGKVVVGHCRCASKPDPEGNVTNVLSRPKINGDPFCDTCRVDSICSQSVELASCILQIRIPGSLLEPRCMASNKVVKKWC